MKYKKLIASIKSLVDKCGDHRKLINQIHALSLTLGLLTHQPFACKLLNAYAKHSNPIHAQKVFDQIPSPDIVSWTCLLSLYLRLHRPTQALSVFSHLLNSKSGLKPDGYTIVGALGASARNKDVLTGTILHGMVFRLGLGVDETTVGNALIDMYGRNGRIRLARMVFDAIPWKDVSSWTSLLNGFVLCGDLESARKLFDEMPRRNAISWTAMIVGYVRRKNPIEALDLFRQMRAAGEEDGDPTQITIVAVLSACADVGAFDFGQSIHGFIHKLPGFATDVASNNALIDMYSKSGALEFAAMIFSKMVNKDLYSWTTMISGLALHGKGRHALEVFHDMLESGATPNEITYLSLLSACAHSGLVNEGRSLFNYMVGRHGNTLKIEHYGCMVDLLGRAGHLKEALELIEKMPVKADAMIWRSILSACLGEKNWELAEMVGEKVLELAPDDDGVYIELWNIYCSANRWEDALKTRKMMRDQRIKKRPGCSWIEVNGVVHEFIAEDARCNFHADMCFVFEETIDFD